MQNSVKTCLRLLKVLLVRPICPPRSDWKQIIRISKDIRHNPVKVPLTNTDKWTLSSPEVDDMIASTQSTANPYAYFLHMGNTAQGVWWGVYGYIWLSLKPKLCRGANFVVSGGNGAFHWHVWANIFVIDTRNFYDANSVVPGGIRCCRNDVLRYRQWRQCWEHGNSRFGVILWYICKIASVVGYSKAQSVCTAHTEEWQDLLMQIVIAAQQASVHTKGNQVPFIFVQGNRNVVFIIVIHSTLTVCHRSLLPPF